MTNHRQQRFRSIEEAYAAGQQEAGSHFHNSPPQYVYAQSPYQAGNGNGNGNGRSMPPQSNSIDKLTVPLLLVCSALVFVVYATWFGASTASEFRVSVDKLHTTFTASMQSITERLERIEKAAETQASAAMSKVDWQLWCARTEIANKGWRCAEITASGVAPMRDTRAPIWNGVLPDQEFPATASTPTTTRR